MFCYNFPMTAFRWPIHVYLSKLDQWEFETLLEALSVEYSFLHMVKMLKQLHQMRMERLLCEENSSFLQLLKDVDDKVQTVIDFVINLKSADKKIAKVQISSSLPFLLFFPPSIAFRGLEGVLRASMDIKSPSP